MEFLFQTVVNIGGRWSEQTTVYLGLAKKIKKGTKKDLIAVFISKKSYLYMNWESS